MFGHYQTCIVCPLCVIITAHIACCRLIAIDHLHSVVYLIALAQCESVSSQGSAQNWLQTTADKLQTLLPQKNPATVPAAESEAAVELARDDMSQLSSQTQQHMDTGSSAALSDEDMLEDDQAYLSASRSYRGQPAKPSGAAAANCTAALAHAASCTDAAQASDRCLHTPEASDTCTDTDQASDKHTDCHHTSQTSDRCTGANEMPAPPPFKLARSRQQYLRDVEACQQALHDGESYEICLTIALVREHPMEALQLYRTLRRVNPAPYAAWLSFGADDMQICCASPERFLKVSNRLHNWSTQQL